MFNQISFSRSLFLYRHQHLSIPWSFFFVVLQLHQLDCLYCWWLYQFIFLYLNYVIKLSRSHLAKHAQSTRILPITETTWIAIHGKLHPFESVISIASTNYVLKVLPPWQSLIVIFSAAVFGSVMRCSLCSMSAFKVRYYVAGGQFENVRPVQLKYATLLKTLKCKGVKWHRDVTAVFYWLPQK